MIPSQTPPSETLLQAVRAAFRRASLPMKVDLLDGATISSEFRDKVKAHYAVFIPPPAWQCTNDEEGISLLTVADVLPRETALQKGDVIWTEDGELYFCDVRNTSTTRSVRPWVLVRFSADVLEDQDLGAMELFGVLKAALLRRKNAGGSLSFEEASSLQLPWPLSCKRRQTLLSEWKAWHLEQEETREQWQNLEQRLQKIFRLWFVEYAPSYAKKKALMAGLSGEQIHAVTLAAMLGVVVTEDVGEDYFVWQKIIAALPQEVRTDLDVLASWFSSRFQTSRISMKEFPQGFAARPLIETLGVLWKSDVPLSWDQALPTPVFLHCYIREHLGSFGKDGKHLKDLAEDSSVLRWVAALLPAKNSALLPPTQIIALFNKLFEPAWQWHRAIKKNYVLLQQAENHCLERLWQSSGPQDER